MFVLFVCVVCVVCVVCDVCLCCLFISDDNKNLVSLKYVFASPPQPPTQPPTQPQPQAPAITEPEYPDVNTQPSAVMQAQLTGLRVVFLMRFINELMLYAIPLMEQFASLSPEEKAPINALERRFSRSSSRTHLELATPTLSRPTSVPTTPGAVQLDIRKVNDAHSPLLMIIPAA